MTDLVAEIAGYIAAAALLGLALGYLVWGWGRRARIAAARAEGARSAQRAAGGAGLREKLAGATGERDRLAAEVALLTARLRALEARTGADRATAPPRPPDATLRQQSLQGAQPPVADQPLPDDGGGGHMPRPPGGTRRRQRPAGADQAPVADEPVPGDSGPESPVAPGAPPATLLAGPPPRPDDLKRIRGIGPALERRLNEAGVYLYGQITGFSSADLAWLAREIGAAPSRIRREAWVEQARALRWENQGRGDE